MHATNIVRDVLRKGCSHIHKARLESLCDVVRAALSASSHTLSNLARALVPKVGATGKRKGSSERAGLWKGAKTLYALATSKALDLGLFDYIRSHPISARLATIKHAPKGRHMTTVKGDSGERTVVVSGLSESGAPER